ncbi:hypothetical protein [uncultured Bacteroides sp.]
MTELGKSLIPILNNLISWAIENSEYITKRKK